MKDKIKPSDIFKTMLGTKEGRDYIGKEIKQFKEDVRKAAEEHFFGKDNKKGGKGKNGTIRLNIQDIK